ncbi:MULTISPECIES: hypothetical protein [Brevibacillus]|jgi:hypothetical protein|uniref:Lipoprotein n=1 Tax=Brevibacillus borstelensis AK1 TaxID=1300222 RepID=M8D4N8_9BACL|nr:hypothetical protein [Brevibacillus borstelensis]EMT51254.1 hypothetical protein I532_18577 [Brevibacillus borstelensis AK1]KKX57174.1 hypothetical protein X546_01260 [Brevibacillus borstelensis cifa_chp40]MBE5397319.1 hypothetical protein [Brevibacillus borstelensis]MCC0567144.1 hypothetical protein [Brevibacillus borstelensis]MCM3472567.1 hypothetical protein [Brevibacillus borstelensis]
MKKVLSTAALLAMLTVSACSNQSTDTKPVPQNEATNATQQASGTNGSDSSAAKTEAPAENASNQTSDKLELKKVLSDKVEILIPKGFDIMSEEMAKVKYPSENRPTLIYTDAEGSINVAFNHTATPIQDGQIKELKDQMKQMFEGLYPDATWYKDEVTQINGKNVGYFELLTPAADTKVYNLIFFTELDGKLLMTTFNCTEQQMDEWKPLAQQILQSYKVN